MTRRPLQTLRALAVRPTLTAEALATRLGLMIELRAFALDRVVRPPAPRRAPSADDIEQIGMIGDLVTSKIPLLRSRCLVRALLRFRLLRRRGHDAIFVMGIDPALPDLEGHAWIELDGKPAFEPALPTCTVTLRSPEAPCPH